MDHYNSHFGFFRDSPNNRVGAYSSAIRISRDYPRAWLDPRVAAWRAHVAHQPYSSGTVADEQLRLRDVLRGQGCAGVIEVMKAWLE